jgi:hypothetical protein
LGKPLAKTLANISVSLGQIFVQKLGQNFCKTLEKLLDKTWAKIWSKTWAKTWAKLTYDLRRLGEKLVFLSNESLFVQMFGSRVTRLAEISMFGQFFL